MSPGLPHTQTTQNELLELDEELMDEDEDDCEDRSELELRLDSD